MPRTSRSVAQRLAAQQSAKSKKRRAPRPVQGAPASSSSVSVDQILDEVVPSEGGLRSASTPTPATETVEGRPMTRRAVPGGRVATRTPGRATAPRRRYSEYGEEYQYVWADLRRIVMVAGVLIVLLIALSFVIQ